MRLLSQMDLTKILKLNRDAITQLVYAGKLPCEKIEGNNIFFNADTIIKWAEKPQMDNQQYLQKLENKLWEINPEFMKSLQNFNSSYTDPYEPKRFYLAKIKNKKLGFVYYVRYLENGVLVPSKWCTHTNDKEAAERFAEGNRERLIAKYYNRDNVKKPYGEMYSILRKYYSENSAYLQIDMKRGKSLSDKSRRHYHNFIVKQFIPYLKKNGIKEFEDIDTPFLARFQNYLLGGTGKRPGVKPQTIKIYLLTVSQIFNHLVIEGHIKANPCKSLVKLKTKN
jgi:hypothetical protein